MNLNIFLTKISHYLILILIGSNMSNLTGKELLKYFNGSMSYKILKYRFSLLINIFA